MSDELKVNFFELFSLSDLYSMQFACECEYGIGSELAVKLEEFLKDVNKDNTK